MLQTPSDNEPHTFLKTKNKPVTFKLHLTQFFFFFFTLWGHVKCAYCFGLVNGEIWFYLKNKVYLPLSHDGQVSTTLAAVLP